MTMAAAAVPRDVTSYGIGLAAPLALFFLVFFVAPLVQLFVLSLHNDTAGVVWGIGQYVHFLTDPFSLSVLGSTLLLGAEVTALCLVLGFPIAWLYHRVGSRTQTLIILIVLLPLLTSVVVRTFAWIVILGRQGIINSTLLSIGAIDTPMRLLYTQVGVVLALAQVQMPLMTLPLITALGRIDMNLEDASCSLGAGSWRTFWRVVLPLSLPGIIAGCTLTYAAAITAFITQSLVGGGQMLFMPMYLYQQASTLQNWPFASAISIIFLLAVLAVVTVFGMLGRLSRGYGGA
jgi:putative spermidine/putrescine transport system permease protein